MALIDIYEMFVCIVVYVAVGSHILSYTSCYYIKY